MKPLKGVSTRPALCPGNKKGRGFSLLELLIALFLLVVIVAGGLLMLYSAQIFWFRGETAVSIVSEARGLQLFLGRFLPGAFVIPSWEDPRPEFVGTPQTLSFWTFLPEQERRTDFIRVDFSFDPEEQTLFIFQERASGHERDFVPLSSRGRQPVSFNLVEFAFSYFDGGEYLSAWDSRPGAAQENRLPAGVRVQYRVAGERKREGELPTQSFESFWEIKSGR